MIKVFLKVYNFYLQLFYLFSTVVLVLFHLAIAKELVTLNETDDVKVPKNCEQHVGNETLLASCINETSSKLFILSHKMS